MKIRKSTPDPLSNLERRIIRELREAPAPEVSAADKDAVCKAAVSGYVPKRMLWDIRFWKAAFSALTLTSISFWVFGAFLLGSCTAVTLLTVNARMEPAAVLIALSPVPMLSFVIHELQYRDPSLAQLEKTCRFSPEKIIFARLWAGMMGNFLIVLALGGTAPKGQLTPVRVYLYAFTAMFFVGAAALIFLLMTESTLPLSLLMMGWILGAVSILSQQEAIDWLEKLGQGAVIGGAAVGMGLFLASAVYTAKRIYAL